MVGTEARPRKTRRSYARAIKTFQQLRLLGDRANSCAEDVRQILIGERHPVLSLATLKGDIARLAAAINALAADVLLEGDE